MSKTSNNVAVQPGGDLKSRVQSCPVYPPNEIISDESYSDITNTIDTIWNSIPDVIQKSPSIYSFKSKLKNYFLGLPYHTTNNRINPNRNNPNHQNQGNRIGWEFNNALPGGFRSRWDT